MAATGAWRAAEGGGGGVSASAVVDAGAPDIPGRGGEGWLARHAAGPLRLAIFRPIPVRFGICLALSSA